MKRGQRSGKTHAREDLAEHFAIKPKATEPPGPTRQNDALRRLQLSPSDPRWQMEPPYGWRKISIAYLDISRNRQCWYCALIVERHEKQLYSQRLDMLCHVECYADGDTIAPKRATVDST